MQNKPDSFSSFIGMGKLKKILKVMINSAKERKMPIDHILLYGPPGLGKTTMAYLISKYTDQPIKYINGNILEKKSDFLTIFSSIKANDLVFVDEIHAMGKNIEELFYSALEDNVIDVIVGVEGESKVIRFKIPPFTLIGATTNFGLISEPLLERFGLSWRFDYYSDEEIREIAKQDYKNQNWAVDEDALDFLISYAKQTPRIVKRLVRRTIDFAILKKDNQKVTKKVIKETLESLKIYNNGLSQYHIEYLKILNDVFANKWVSLMLISNILRDSTLSVETQIEPLLFKLNMIEKTSKGRKITSLGKEFLEKLGN